MENEFDKLQLTRTAEVLCTDENYNKIASDNVLLHMPRAPGCDLALFRGSKNTDDDEEKDKIYLFLVQVSINQNKDPSLAKDMKNSVPVANRLIELNMQLYTTRLKKNYQVVFFNATTSAARERYQRHKMQSKSTTAVCSSLWIIDPDDPRFPTSPTTSDG